jgi:hypothetical protein
MAQAWGVEALADQGDTSAASIGWSLLDLRTTSQRATASKRLVFWPKNWGARQTDEEAAVTKKGVSTAPAEGVLRYIFQTS